MPTREEDLEKVKSRRKQARQSIEQAGVFEAGASTFADQVMGNVRKAREERGVNRLAEDIGTTTGQIVSEPANIRARTEGVNPLAVDAITQQQLAQTLGTLATQSNIQESRQGTISDILGAGSNQLLAAAAEKQAEADAAETEAKGIMDMIRLRMEEERNKLQNALTQARIEDLRGQGDMADISSLLQVDETTGQITVPAESYLVANPEQRAALKAFEDAQEGNIDPNNLPRGERINTLKDSTQRSNASEAMNIFDQLVKLKRTFDEVPEGAFQGIGPIAGRLNRLQAEVGITPTLSDAMSNYMIAAEEVFTDIRKESTGAVFTDREIKELERIFSRGTRSHEFTRKQIENALDKPIRRLGNLGLTPMTFVDLETGDLFEADDVDEYITKTSQARYEKY